MDQNCVRVCSKCSVANGQESSILPWRSKMWCSGWVSRKFVMLVCFRDCCIICSCSLWSICRLSLLVKGQNRLNFFVELQRRTLSIGFWEGKQFVCMPFVHCGRHFSATKGYFDLGSRLLSAISSDATSIWCGGSRAIFVKAWDENPGRKVGVRYPFTLTPLHFERLLHKPSFSVMGRIDMCSKLRTLLIRQNGLLEEHWVQSTQHFRRVRIGNNFLLLSRV